MKNEKISIGLIVVYQLHSNLVFSVRKGTVNIVLTICTIVGIVGAELCFVFLETIQLFYLVMTFITLFTLGTHEIVVFILDVLF